MFLSHNRRDQHAVERIALRLKHAGLEPWLDVWCGTPGGDWQEELADGLARSSACAVFIGRHDLGGWERIEVAVALDRSARERGFRIFPVLLPGLEPFDPNSLPPFLSTRTWVNFRQGLDSSRALQELIFAVKGVPFGTDAPIESREEVCPYRGLKVFEEDDAQFFFGREGDVQRLLERLKTSRLLAVLGPSGSGKSSLVRAGLVPGLRAGGVSGSEAWTIRVMRPGAEPLSALAAQLLSLSAERGMQATVDALAGDQRTLHLGTALALAERPLESRVAFVIDQLEEVFTLCRDSTSRARFFENLCYATAAPGGRTVVILTMRADFYPRMVDHPVIAQFMQADQVLVGTLREDSLRQVIEEPAYRVGVEFEPGLSDTILGDISGRPGVLPLLEHALLETWRRRRGHMLTLEGYRDSGGVHRAVAERAQALYTTLGPDEQAMARSVLLRLTQPGDGTEDTRRRVPLVELVDYEHDRRTVEGVVRRFVDARLLTTSGEDTGDKTWVEVAHEALIRGWPSLRQWIEADRAGLRIHRSLTAAASEWQRLGDDRGALYAGAQLAEVITWQEQGDRGLNALERDFLTASRDRERQLRTARRRRTQVAFAGLAIALAAITTVALVAVDRGRDAIRQRDLAQSRQLAASAANVLIADPGLGLALATRAVDAAPTTQASAMLRQATLAFRRIAVIQAGEGWTYSAAFSPDAKHAVSGGDDNVVRVWDLADRRIVATVRGHRNGLNSVRFSPDGERIASAGNDGTVAVSDSDGRQRRVILRVKDQFVSTVAFSADGQQVVSAVGDGTVRVTNVDRASRTTVLRGHDGEVYGADFSPDGQHVVSAGEDATVRIWDIARRSATVLRGHSGPVFTARYSEDGSRVVSTGADGGIRIWNAHSGAALASFRGDEDALYVVDFSPDGHRVLAAGQDGVITVWDDEGGPPLVRLRGHRGRVLDASFSKVGNRVITAGEDGTLRIWDPGNDQLLRGPATSPTFSHDGRRVAAGGTDGALRIWNVVTGKLERTQHGQTGTSWARFSPDGHRLVSAAEDGTVRIVRSSDGGVERVLQPGRDAVYSAAFDPTGRRIVSGELDGTVLIQDVDGGRRMVLRGHSGAVHDVVFDPDGDEVASAGADGTIRVWSAEHKYSAAKTMRGHSGAVNSVAYNRAGTKLVSGGVDGTIRVWSLRGGAPRILRGHEGSVETVSFSPTGGRILSAGMDGTVRIWDAGGSETLVVLRTHRGRAFGAAFSRDGDVIASAGADGTIRLSGCEVCGTLTDVRALARSRAQRRLTQQERKRFLPEGSGG